jgi:hypothetical protein
MALVLPFGWGPNKTIIRIGYQQVAKTQSQTWLTDTSGTLWRVNLQTPILQTQATGAITVDPDADTIEFTATGTYEMELTLPMRTWGTASVAPNYALTNDDGTVEYIPTSGILNSWGDLITQGNGVYTLRVAALFNINTIGTKLAWRVRNYTTVSGFIEVMGTSGGASAYGSGTAPAWIGITKYS